MQGRRQVAHHHGQGDINDRIKIEATGQIVSHGGADCEYIVDAGRLCSIVFHVTCADAKTGEPILAPNGLTNEALLAIVMDRLLGFQAGKFACLDNELAIEAIKSAMAALRRRTATRQKQGGEGKMEQHTPEGAAGRTVGRLTVAADQLKVAGTEKGEIIAPIAQLHDNWGQWSGLESLLRRLEPPITDAELDLLGTIPVTQAARNGFHELRSALKSTFKA